MTLINYDNTQCCNKNRNYNRYCVWCGEINLNYRNIKTFKNKNMIILWNRKTFLKCKYGKERNCKNSSESLNFFHCGCCGESFRNNKKIEILCYSKDKYYYCDYILKDLLNPLDDNILIQYILINKNSMKTVNLILKEFRPYKFIQNIQMSNFDQNLKNKINIQKEIYFKLFNLLDLPNDIFLIIIDFLLSINILDTKYYDIL